MEHTGTTPAVGIVHAPDLAELLAARGPVATIYLTTEAGVENASHLSEARWKNLRRDLARAGADETVLTTVDPIIGDAHRSGECLALVVASDGVRHREHLPQPPTRDLARWGELPSIVPLLEWRQTSVPHVVVLTDRRGADIVAVGGSDGLRDRKPPRRDRADGSDGPITKVGAGGWSQRRFQQRAENTWAENAGEVADHTRRLAEQVDARVIVAAGDVRAVSMLEDALPEELQDKVVVVEGGRARDGSTSEIASEVVRQLDTVAARDTVELLRKFREEQGRGDRMTDGVDATVAALTRSQVEVLLVHDDPDDDRQAWFGAEASRLATSPEQARALGIEHPDRARLPDVLVRAALGTGAGVRVVPAAGGPRDGVGAILRWT
jgi:hypothetical protein